MFLGTLKRFNDNKECKMSKNIVDFFNFFWITNNNVCMIDEQDLFLFSQLPLDVQNQLWLTYLHREFL